MWWNWDIKRIKVKISIIIVSYKYCLPSTYKLKKDQCLHKYINILGAYYVYMQVSKLASIISMLTWFLDLFADF